MNKAIKLVFSCSVILIVLCWIIGFFITFAGVAFYFLANLCILSVLYLMLDKWTNLPLGSSIKDAKIKKQKKDILSITAIDELESGQLDKLVWSQALKKAKGDEKKAKAIYIELREKDI